MDGSRSCDRGRAKGPGWTEGYAAAIDDAVGLIEAMGGGALSNLSSPVLMHLKARLNELRAKERQGVAQCRAESGRGGPGEGSRVP